MRNLLKANFAKLWKSTGFWVGIACMLIYAVYYHTNYDKAHIKLREVSLDDRYFAIAGLIGLVCAVFASLFLGREYGDGVMRNKLITGLSRREVYIANLLTVYTATAVFMAAWFIGGLSGVPVLEAWDLNAIDSVMYFFICALIAAVYAAVFTFVGMLIANKAAAPVISIVLFLVLYVAGILLDNVRFFDESNRTHIWVTRETKYGWVASYEEGINPDYVRGFKRRILDGIVYILPAGQAEAIHPHYKNSIAPRPGLMITSSILVTLTLTAAGLRLFRDKDIR